MSFLINIFQMKTRIGIFSVWILASSLTAFSQVTDSVEKDFFVGIGFTAYQIRDQLVSNIRHDGNFASLSLFHRKWRDVSIREIHFDLIFNPLTSRYESEAKSIVTNLAINYRYLMHVNKSNQDLQLFLGPIGGINWHLNYYNAWDESHIYWVSTYCAGIDGRLSYRVSEKIMVGLDVNLPVVVLVSRPPERFLYKEMDPKFSWVISRLHDDMKLTSVHQHFEFNSTVDLIYALSKKFKLGAFWRFQYLQNQLPDSKEVNIAVHTFGVYLIF